MFFIFLYFLSITLYNPIIGGFNLSNYILGIGVLFLFLFKNLRIKAYSFKQVDFSSYLIMILFFLAISMFAKDINTSITLLIKITFPILFSIWILNVVETNKDFIKFINILFYAGIVASIYGFIQYKLGLSNYMLGEIDGQAIYRSTGAFQQPNVFASFLILIFPFMIYKLVLLKNKMMKIIHALLFIFYFLSIYYSYSRWAIVTLVVSFFVIYLINMVYKVKKTGISKKILMLLPIFFVAIYLFINKYWIYLKTIFMHRESSDIRSENISTAFQKFGDNIFGYGLGNGTDGMVLDSSYLNLLIDTGIIGISLFVFFLLALFIKNIKLFNFNFSFNNIYFISLVSIVIFGINAVLETLIYNSLTNIFLGIYIFILNANKDKIYNERLT